MIASDAKDVLRAINKVCLRQEWRNHISSSPTLPPPVEIPRSPATPDAPAPSEDVLLRVPQRSHPLAAGDLSLHRIRAGDTSLAAIASLDAVQWPLARDVVAVKLDPRHYSFSFAVPASPDDPAPDPLHYGLTLSVPDPRLDALLDAYTRFSAHSVAGSEGLAYGVRGEVEAAAYWTVVAPNVEEYGSAVARAITSGAENVAKGILWCGVMTVDRLRWGNEVLRKRIQPGDTEAEVSPEMLSQIKR
uniref:Senescence domain-containing protein n=1 Tax=Hordeum vulgare subsp. vulgare TaxID=112509 RepID=A0A8I6YJ67_HORVV